MLFNWKNNYFIFALKQKKRYISSKSIVKKIYSSYFNKSNKYNKFYMPKNFRKFNLRIP